MILRFVAVVLLQVLRLVIEARTGLHHLHRHHFHLLACHHNIEFHCRKKIFLEACSLNGDHRCNCYCRCHAVHVRVDAPLPRFLYRQCHRHCHTVRAPMSLKHLYLRLNMRMYHLVLSQTWPDRTTLRQVLHGSSAMSAYCFLQVSS